MSHQQPGPYGQQGPQPGQPGPYGTPPPGQPPAGGNPYAQPQPGAQPGYGYPQQQPPGQPGYGYPPPGGQPGQPGYGYPQQPGQPGYGYPQQPGAPVPPGGQAGRSGKGRNVGITVAVVAALAVVGGGLYAVLSGGDNALGSDDGTRYDLTLPQQTGDFELMEEDNSILLSEQELEEAGLTDMEGVGGSYIEPDPDAPIPDWGRVGLGFAGMWGEVENPQQTVDLLFLQFAQSISEEEGQEIELVGTAESFTYEEAALKCQIARGTEEDPDLGYTMEITVCAWADYSTVGLTYYLPFPELPADVDPLAEEMPEVRAPETIPTGEAADHTRQLREDALVERTG
ncbi:hypothetical protein [Streptomyces calidiresistens]|uniref:Uncharacterized protein n=1 Tax=Streptomyces calidiresistens TaxID=1485586 RepID=A0A7W3XW79_9ACTN|nr:hypothetical protein [Streptomyces calidiresistens]MBB0229568.1 hypothetical protein [Streptomyces calidiresistens]